MGKLRSALLESLKLIKEAIPALAHDDDRQKLLDAQELIRETIRDGILDIDDVKKKLTAIPISRFGAAKPVEKILGLTNIATASEDFWRLRKIEYFRMPSHLKQDLDSWDKVLNIQGRRSDVQFEISESLIRVRLNSIMRELLLWEQRRLQNLIANCPDAIWMTTEAPMKYRATKDGKACLLNGKADYVIWYANGKTDTNLLVVEAKKEGNFSDGIGQCLAYAGIVHRQKKELGFHNATVFGVATDSFAFAFIKVNNNSEYSVWQSSEFYGLDRDIKVWSLLVKMFAAVTEMSLRASPLPQAHGYLRYRLQDEWVPSEGS